MKPLLVTAGVLAIISASSLTSAFRRTPSSMTPQVEADYAKRSDVHFVDSEISFGRVKLNDELRGSFVVVNGSDRNVELSEPAKSCSCTLAELDRRTLAPGERCALEFVIKTGQRRTPRAETIMITCASSTAVPRQLFATVLFEPKGVFEVDPPIVELTRAKPTATIVVRADQSADRHEVLNVHPNHRCLRVSGRPPVVTIEMDPELVDEAITTTECVIYTNNLAEQMISVPVRIRKH